MKTSIKALTIALGVLSAGISAYAVYSSDMDHDEMNQTQENRWRTSSTTERWNPSRSAQPESRWSSSSTTERWSPARSTQPENRWSATESEDSSMRMRNVADEDVNTSESMSMSETSERPYRSGMQMQQDPYMHNAPMYNVGYNNGECCPRRVCPVPCAPRCAPAPCAPRCAAPCAPVCRPRCAPVCKPRCAAPCAPVCRPRCAPVCKPRCVAPCAPVCRPRCAPVCPPRCPAPCAPVCRPRCAPVCKPRCAAPCAPVCRARCEPVCPVARPCCIAPSYYQPYGVNYYPGYGYGTQFTN